MKAVQNFVNKHHDLLIKVGGLLGIIFLAIYVPAHNYIVMRNQIEDHVAYETQLRSKIQELDSEVSIYKQSYDKVAFVQKETECLAKNIYYEAGSTSDEGMRAVAQVTLNRKREHFAKTICGVVYQKSGHTCQFSWVCERKNPPNVPSYRKAYDIARNSLIRGIASTRLKTALYFHADYTSPSWKQEKTFITQVGPHIFYAE